MADEELSLVEQRAGNRWLSRKDRTPGLADSYETPSAAVTELLVREQGINGLIVDPCCGRGSIVREVRRSRPLAIVVGSELRDIPLPDNCVGNRDGFDFLQALVDSKTNPDWIVMNPPFNNAEAFTLASLEAVKTGVAVFNRCQWTEAKGRHERLWGLHKAARQWIFSCRYDCYPEGNIDASSGMMSFSWFIFLKDHHGPMITDWIDTPLSWEFDTRYLDLEWLRGRINRAEADLLLPDKTPSQKSAIRAMLRKMRQLAIDYPLRMERLGLAAERGIALTSSAPAC